MFTKNNMQPFKKIGGSYQIVFKYFSKLKIRFSSKNVDFHRGYCITLNTNIEWGTGEKRTYVNGRQCE